MQTNHEGLCAMLAALGCLLHASSLECSWDAWLGSNVLVCPQVMGRNVTGEIVLANVDYQGADADIRPLPPGQEPSP
ncbi:hypothetical protein Plim_0110 [Planctopirus limnophila DSM 3776]|uniref:Uncharacterized protein n=1 Tax=Planctopirus limnophila (strain ATCC 43296 / DSM 3776 / IFAM 1008 / Mu 290) TaxID=521674 RepID=D5SN36_PLAL2|nr:hypothetical protein Plim_0110 [Planctopirus limnophila DSM 3776]